MNNGGQDDIATQKVDGRTRSGKARMEKLSAEGRQKLASTAAKARWRKAKLPNGKEIEYTEPLDNSDDISMSKGWLPEAKYKGVLNLVGTDLPCYVLNNGMRVVGRTSFTELLTGIRGGGALEKYLGVEAFKPFISLEEVLERMVPFRLPEVEGLERQVKGLPADALIDICKGFMAALEANYRADKSGVKLTPRQREMAIKAGMFVTACAKVGLDALIDEATGAQFDRAEDALQVKLRAYLADELRKWEKTFPDELWNEFARLTNWKGTVTQRPKYWGKLVTELVYEYLDSDVALWLKENEPQPRHGRNWHSWLNDQYGLPKLIQHIYILIGVARTCGHMSELRRKMAEMNGKVPVQYTLFVPANELVDRSV
jgi:hypothetical protein